MSWLGVIWPQARGGLAVHNSSTRAMEKKLESLENEIIMTLDKKMPEARVLWGKVWIRVLWGKVWIQTFGFLHLM